MATDAVIGGEMKTVLLVAVWIVADRGAMVDLEAVPGERVVIRDERNLFTPLIDSRPV